MKMSLLILVPLAMGTAAIAQDAPPASAPADTTADAAPADTANYPACSRTVHDKCMQGHMARRRHR